MKSRLHLQLRRLGVDVVRYNGTNFLEARRSELLRAQNVDLAFDVGANVGQFGARLRRSGYDGHIVSFEPLPDAYERLVARSDAKWTTHNIALGESKSVLPLHRAANSWSSSLLPMTHAHLAAAPESAYVGDITVEVSPLDEFWEPNRRFFVKIDTQGYEASVLDGGSRVLADTQLLELELSLTTLYDGQPSLAEMLDRTRDFKLAAIEPAFRDPRTADILQLDALFVRRP